MVLLSVMQVPHIYSSHIKLVNHFHSSGSTKNGERDFMLLQWLLLELDGPLLCLVGQVFLIRYIGVVDLVLYTDAVYRNKGFAPFASILYFLPQVVELDFLYPSEGIHRRWDSGYRITSTAATWDQTALVLSNPRRKPSDETQETLRTSAFPSTHVKVDFV